MVETENVRIELIQSYLLNEQFSHVKFPSKIIKHFKQRAISSHRFADLPNNIKLSQYARWENMRKFSFNICMLISYLSQT